MDNNLSQELDAALGEVHADVEPGQRPISINREGSGHTLTVNDTAGTVMLGIIALTLLVALLRSERRNRELQQELRAIST